MPLVDLGPPVPGGLAKFGDQPEGAGRPDDEMYLLTTTHLGWTADRFQAWLTDSLQRLLLPDAPVG